MIVVDRLVGHVDAGGRRHRRGGRPWAPEGRHPGEIGLHRHHHECRRFRRRFRRERHRPPAEIEPDRRGMVGNRPGDQESRAAVPGDEMRGDGHVELEIDDAIERRENAGRRPLPQAGQGIEQGATAVPQEAAEIDLVLAVWGAPQLRVHRGAELRIGQRDRDVPGDCREPRAHLRLRNEDAVATQHGQARLLRRVLRRAGARRPIPHASPRDERHCNRNE